MVTILLACGCTAHLPVKQTLLENDTQLKTKSGATFTAPKGWFVTSSKEFIVLEDPDRQLLMVLLENHEPNAAQAIESGWEHYRPEFARVVKQSIQIPPQDGLDEVTQVSYETTTQEERIILGVGLRKNKTWYVVLLDSTRAALDRRNAQVMTALTSLKVPGAEPESFAGKKAHPLDAKKLKAFAAFVEDARQQSKVPGAAIAIVQGDKIIFERGFGVTPASLFMIGSTTKSLTTLMMAKLIDEGKFTWDTPVTRISPTFALGDEAATKKLEMKYTMCACTGLPRQDMDLLFHYSKETPETRVKEMGAMKPTTGFGETFQYSNGLVSAGGYIAALAAGSEKDLGLAYDAAMQSRVFDPIGMKSTTFDFNVVAQKEHALPHGADLNLNYIPMRIEDEQWVTSIRPAGGAWSNVQDMARYIMFELTKGTTGSAAKRRESQVKISDKVSYGLGLMMADDHGVQVMGHDGNTMGFSSGMFFMPEQQVGAVILTNAQGAGAFTGAVRRRLMELLFDGKAEAQETLTTNLNLWKEISKKGLENVSFSPDRNWLSKIAGTYANKSLGTVTIRLSGEKAILDASEWKSPVAQKTEKDGVRKLILTNSPVAGLEFIPEEHAGKTTLKLETAQQKYVFEPIKL